MSELEKRLNKKAKDIRDIIENDLVSKSKAIEAHKKYLDLYIGDYDDKDIKRFERLLDE